MSARTEPHHDHADPAGNPPKRLFDRPDGYSGQAYTPEDAARQEREDPSGSLRRKSEQTGADADEGNTPPESGRKAYHDPETGTVHGSGSGAGGGNPGEDYDSDAQGGSGYPGTGASSRRGAEDPSAA